LQPWCVMVLASTAFTNFVAVLLWWLARPHRLRDRCMVVWFLLWNFIAMGLMAAMVQKGVGLHVGTEVLPDELVKIEKLQLGAEILYIFTLVWTKMSFLLLLHNIFSGDANFRLGLCTIGVLIIAWPVCMAWLCVLRCIPTQKIWHPSLPGHCINRMSIWIANAIVKGISDFAILILPLPFLWGLRMEVSRKVFITGVFGFGLLGIAVSAYQFKTLIQYSTDDRSYTLARIVGWSAIEMSIWIISACLPTLR
ncbi:hypothetical protein BGZ61DRAFT_311158, partial [Ilyonectria robusta]|uniref:uncharacterized protein n=1 Tax=Ilyonectria robusta TaxID=1079257 RepID=UPI001E8DE4DA